MFGNETKFSLYYSNTHSENGDDTDVKWYNQMAMPDPSASGQTCFHNSVFFYIDSKIYVDCVLAHLKQTRRAK